MARTSIVVRAVAIAFTAVVVGALAAPSVSAHTQLVSTDPADGSTLPQSPASVLFTFDERLLDGMSTVSINDEQGQMVQSSPGVTDGSTLTLPIEPALAPGTYQAAYRVVSADGHAVSGAITFTVAGDAASSPKATPASVTPPTPTTSAAAVPAEETGTPWALWALGGLIVLGIVAGILVVLRSGAGPRQE